VKVYDTAHVRNLAVVGHGGCGKTTLVSAALYTAGATPKMGRVEEGTTVTDFDEQEIQRRFSICSAVGIAEWNKNFKFNFIDTPGSNIFIHEAELAMAAVECVLLVVDATAGVEVRTETVWRYAQEHHLPVIVVINRMDRERADAGQALASVQEAFGRSLCPVQLPIGQADHFQGVVDLVGMRGYIAAANGNGRSQESGVPGVLADEAKAAHETLVELVAEGDDRLMEEFFERGTIDAEHLENGLHEALRDRRLSPVLFCAGGTNQGVDALLNFLAKYAPAPPELGEVEAVTAPEGGSVVRRPEDDAQPLALYVFKTLMDPFSGRVSFFKVRSGIVKTEATVTNFNRGVSERLAHLCVMQGKQPMPVPELHAGDIGAVAKLRETFTGDTLGDKAAPIFFRPIRMDEPAITFAVEARKRNDEDKLGIAVHKMVEEDLALRFFRDAQTGDFLLAGTGQQHLEITVAKLKQRYHVDVALKAPKVAYRETIRGKADVQGRYKKQTGGHGQYGDCKVRFEPLSRGAGFAFANEVFGGAIPKNFIPAVEKGIVESAQRGFLAGFPMVDFRATVYDGSYHDVDSSEMAFKVAGSLAFKKGMEQAHPALLEPIMEVEVHCPQEFAGDVIGDLNARRGRIEGMEAQGRSQRIRAQVPQAEMLAYQSDLTAKTQGRGSFHMHFSHYDVMPALQAEKVVAESKAHRGATAADEAE